VRKFSVHLGRGTRVGSGGARRHCGGGGAHQPARQTRSRGPRLLVRTPTSGLCPPRRRRAGPANPRANSFGRNPPTIEDFDARRRGEIAKWGTGRAFKAALGGGRRFEPFRAWTIQAAGGVVLRTGWVSTTEAAALRLMGDDWEGGSPRFSHHRPPGPGPISSRGGAFTRAYFNTGAMTAWVVARERLRLGWSRERRPRWAARGQKLLMCSLNLSRGPGVWARNEQVSLPSCRPFIAAGLSGTPREQRILLRGIAREETAGAWRSFPAGPKTGFIRLWKGRGLGFASFGGLR